MHTSSSASAHLILVDVLYATVEVQSPSLVCVPHCHDQQLGREGEENSVTQGQLYLYSTFTRQTASNETLNTICNNKIYVKDHQTYENRISKNA